MLSIGIVGLPNVGKSTLFNALLKSQLAEAANFAFTTIEPNIGIVEVPDERLDALAEVEKSARTVRATIKFVDIAGLIAGAHRGEGLGNKFLSHIREVEAIALVVRFFDDSEVVHISGQINPRKDIQTILDELALADLEALDKRKIGLEKEARGMLKEATKTLEVFEKVERGFKEGKKIVDLNLTEEERKLIQETNFLTSKPFVYVFNVKESKANETAEDLIEEFGLGEIEGIENAVVVSAKVEEELSQLSELDQKELLGDLGLNEPGLNRLVRVAYEALDLIPFFTAGPQEARAWTVRAGAKAPEAAGKIHSDFAKKFIKAEVVRFEDFVKLGGWKGSKEAGKARLEGRDYEVKDGDVIFFHHG